MNYAADMKHARRTQIHGANKTGQVEWADTNEQQMRTEREMIFGKADKIGAGEEKEKHEVGGPSKKERKQRLTKKEAKNRVKIKLCKNTGKNNGERGRIERKEKGKMKKQRKKRVKLQTRNQGKPAKKE